MSDTNEIDEIVPGEPFATVEAFIDGECVTGEALKHALSDAAGLEHFIELLTLRDAVSTMGPVMWATLPRVRPMQRVKWAAAVAVLAGSFGVAYIAGRHAAPAPPTSGVAAVVNYETRTVAPRPTTVISLKPGVNWTDHIGGE